MANVFVGFDRIWLWISVIVAQIVWAIRYGPLFSRWFMKENGFTEESMKWWTSMWVLMPLEIISSIVFFLWLWLLLQYVWADHKREIWLLYFLWVLTTKWSDVIRGMNKTRRTWFMAGGKVAITMIISLLLYAAL